MKLNHNLFKRGSKIVCRWKVPGEKGEHIVSTGEHHEKGPEAWKRARDIRDRLMAGETIKPTLKPAEGLTIGQLESYYLSCPSDALYETRVANVNALKRILRHSLALKNVDNTYVNAINEAGLKYCQDRPVKTISVNSTILQAQSVFSKRCMLFYHHKGIADFDVSYFMSMAPLRYTKESKRVPVELINRIDELATTLTGNMRLAFLLVRRCALRNREIYNLKTSALHQHGDQYWIDPNHTKTGVERQIPISRELYEELVAPREYVLEGDALQRQASVNRQLSKWVRDIAGPGYTKTVYLLRRRCVVEMREQWDNVIASKIAGHSKEIAFSEYDHVPELPSPLNFSKNSLHSAVAI